MDCYDMRKQEISELVAQCKSKQGEYLPMSHGPGSWATTYSSEFIDSASNLYLIFQELKLKDPLYHLAGQFRLAGIRSCRGTEFNIDRAKYLYQAHLRQHIEKLQQKRKNKPVQNRLPCPFCSKMVVDIPMHVSQSHPGDWDKFFLQNVIDLKGKIRCQSCGSFMKTLDGHQEKCLNTLKSNR